MDETTIHYELHENGRFIYRYDTVGEMVQDAYKRGALWGASMENDFIPGQARKLYAGEQPSHVVHGYSVVKVTSCTRSVVQSTEERL